MGGFSCFILVGTHLLLPIPILYSVENSVKNVKQLKGPIGLALIDEHSYFIVEINKVTQSSLKS